MGIFDKIKQVLSGTNSQYEEMEFDLMDGVELGKLNALRVFDIINDIPGEDITDPLLLKLQGAVRAGYRPGAELIGILNSSIQNDYSKTIIAFETKNNDMKAFYAEHPEEKEKVLAKRVWKDSINLKKDESGKNFSKFTGAPDLPPGLSIPVNPEGKPLDFIAQISCAELPPSKELPAAGFLYFFYDIKAAKFGNSESDGGYWKVIYATDAPAGNGPAASAEYEEKRIAFKPGKTWHTAEVEYGIESEDTAGKKHQMLGFPFEIQHGEGMKDECTKITGSPAGTEWILLLQVDSDDDIGWMWSDAGMLYFWIRKDDLARRNFDHVWMIKECY